MRFALAPYALFLSAAAAAPPPPGALSCSGCHTVDPKLSTSIPRLVGRKPAEIEAAMQEFRTGRRPATVMDRIAKGFTGDETRAIADWYAGQRLP